MKIEYKIFRIIFFSLVSAPFFFFGMLLVRIELDRYLKYGEKRNMVLIKIDGYSGSGIAGGGQKYVFYDPDSNLEYFSNIRTQGGVNPAKKDVLFMSNAQLRDTVLVQIVSEIQVEILQHENNIINSPNRFISVFWRAILIFILFSIGFFILYQVIKTLKTKTTYN